MGPTKAVILVLDQRTFSGVLSRSLFPLSFFFYPLLYFISNASTPLSVSKNLTVSRPTLIKIPGRERISFILCRMALRE